MMDKANERKRDSQLDLIRVIAILLVVIIHCQETCNFNNIIIYYICRLAVPLFFMITGALVYKNRKEITLKKIVNMYTIFLLWCLIYNVLYAEEVNFNNLKDAIFLRACVDHLWYIKIVLLIYIFMKIFPTITDKVFEITFAIDLYVFNIVLLINKKYIIYNNKINAMPIVGLIFIIVGYLIYDKKILRKLNIVFLISIFIVSFLLFILTYNIFYNLERDVWWYWNPFIISAGIIFFEILLRIRTVPFKNILELISKNTFGIYTIHIYIIKLLSNYDVIDINSGFKVVIYSCVTFTISFIITYILGKIKLVRKLVWQ